MHMAEHVADLVQVVLGRQPRPGDQPVVVRAALAIDQHELDGRAGGELAEEVSNQHGLAEPSQPRDHHAGDLGQPDHDRRAVLGPAQPPGGQGVGGHAGKVDPGRGQERVTVQPPELDQPWALLLGSDGDTAPGVGQVAGGPLVVSQTSASDGRHRGGHALVVSDELGGWEAVLAGPLIPIAKPQGLRQQRPLRRQPPGLAGSLTDGGLLGMAAGLTSPKPPGEQAAGQGGGPADQGQQQRQPDEGGEHLRHLPHRVQRGRRRRAISSPSQQRSTSPPSPSSARSGGSSGRASRSRTPDSQGRPARPGRAWRAVGSSRIMGSTS